MIPIVSIGGVEAGSDPGIYTFFGPGTYECCQVTAQLPIVDRTDYTAFKILGVHLARSSREELQYATKFVCARHKVIDHADDTVSGGCSNCRRRLEPDLRIHYESRMTSAAVFARFEDSRLDASNTRVTSSKS